MGAPRDKKNNYLADARCTVLYLVLYLVNAQGLGSDVS